jgi:predicted amidohydrolase
MNLLEKDISGHLSTSKLRFLIVQLNSPFGPEKELAFFAQFEQFQWLDKGSIEQRRRKIASLIEFLRSSPELRPDFLVFPEYAVPKECHVLLREFAAAQRCIVVAGSYYETERGQPLYRSNISTTFLPDDSLRIVKRNWYPAERDAMQALPAEPNVLRLKWRYGKENKFASVSIFICRDYLIPYDANSDGLHISLLDWDRSGLNIVVMCSGETRLFHGAAAFDVRRLRGGVGKFVALCNCAGAGIDGSDGGSALLGPTGSGRRERDDVIVQLPSGAEGMILGEIDVDNVAVVETKPDKVVHDPLMRSTASTFVWQDDYRRLNLKPFPGSALLVPASTKEASGTRRSFR